MGAEVAFVIQILQLLLSFLIIPLLAVLFKLYEKLRDLELYMEQRFATKEEHKKLAERVDHVERRKTSQNRPRIVQAT